MQGYDVLKFFYLNCEMMTIRLEVQALMQNYYSHKIKIKKLYQLFSIERLT